MKKKSLNAIVAVMALIIVMGMQVCAATTRLDVKAGDVESMRTLKDGGAFWENYYYVTPERYVGYPVIAHSMSLSGAYTSPFTQMENGAGRYKYGQEGTPAGIYYKLVAGPSYSSGADWHLEGRYTS